ncbi:anaerobic ribonucleoside-triphosphate reductase activating protein [Aliarcobacter vitoriensis]|uniref:Anaerobic ribonucleoside-triphosphate reductase activating protein n=1 Tax=Aliarcobacter vitoriensis TaxID=2011099 RepID=A0A366MW25_9BACT|nr:anaerobic ribonucleoside-triphosphate reductase activating protein [Aliarcobacter vitoriensis]RBQ30053.1 anaerobic ribonucleoside-triphosphate reductase activating protein [Aliarcobacter vitoriensis]
MNQKIVYDFTRFTTTDYVGEISCIVWHISCNLRCNYCYNDNIVFAKQGLYTHNDILDFLSKRKTLLTAVVLSGGEATMHNLVFFCEKVKKLGFKIKLDTNGTNLKAIKKLLSKNLIDFIAIDFKAPKDKFKFITKKDSYDDMLNTIKYLLKIDFPFELRTTVNRNFIDENDIKEIINTIYCLGYRNVYYIQNFLQTSSNIGNITQNKLLNKDLIDNSKLTIKYRN